MLVAARKAGPLFPQAHGRGDFCRAWEMPAASLAEPAGARLLAAHPKRGHMEGEAATWWEKQPHGAAAGSASPVQAVCRQVGTSHTGEPQFGFTAREMLTSWDAEPLQKNSLSLGEKSGYFAHVLFLYPVMLTKCSSMDVKLKKFVT